MQGELEGSQRIRSAEQLEIIIAGAVGSIRNVHEERRRILENEIYEDTGERYP